MDKLPSNKDLALAISKFKKIIGKEWVFTAKDDIDLYRDAYSPLWGQKDELKASGAVAPKTVKEVQEIVKIANRYKIPLFPISTGKNLGYGGSAPYLSGSIVLDLKRMNKIIEVNEERGYALVEPGVSYIDLYEYIQKKRLNLWIDCPEPGWGSLIGNAMDRGLGWTVKQYRDHFNTHCGMEVVLPDGELLRTGMGALPGADTWQDYPHGFGASLDNVFAQSNLGITTKMGFRLFPAPEGLRCGNVQAKNYTDIIALTTVVNRLEASGVADGLTNFGSPVLGYPGIAPIPDVPAFELMGKKGGPTEKDLTTYAKGRDYWDIRLSFSGESSITKAKWEYAKKELKKAVPHARFGDEIEYKLPLDPKIANSLEVLTTKKEKKVTFGIPNLECFANKLPLGLDGHIWCSPIIPRTGKDLMKAQQVFSQAMLETGVFLGPTPPMPLTISPHCYFFVLPAALSSANPEHNKKTIAALDKMIDIGAKHGWGEYRAPPIFQDKIRGLFNFNDNVLLKTTETIKDALDPNGILAAGRYGIWPKHLRGKK